MTNVDFGGVVEAAVGGRNRSGTERSYLYGKIVDLIREMILDGRLAVGDKLPPERALARQFGVSRNCVRQAVQALAERGILESRQGDGTYVRAPDESVLTENLAQAMAMHAELLEDIWEFRFLIEPQIAFLAAKSITREEIDRLKVLVFDQQKSMLAGSPDPELDVAFHRAIVKAARNKVVLKMMEMVNEVLNESRVDLLQSHARTKASVTGHLKLIDALERNDPDAACHAMREHLAEVEKTVWAGGVRTSPADPQNISSAELSTTLT
jgi:GntR family transcriptional repressor for pyruvate dehydrogenase complex